MFRDRAGWRRISEQPIGYPKWSPDGKYIYGNIGAYGEIKAARMEVATGRLEEIGAHRFQDTRSIRRRRVVRLGRRSWTRLTVRDLR